MTYCPSKKVSYQNRGDADWARKHLETIPGSRRQRPYQCARCGLWHLSSMTRREHKAAQARRRSEMNA